MGPLDVYLPVQRRRLPFLLAIMWTLSLVRLELDTLTCYELSIFVDMVAITIVQHRTRIRVRHSRIRVGYTNIVTVGISGLFWWQITIFWGLLTM